MTRSSILRQRISEELKNNNITLIDNPYAPSSKAKTADKEIIVEEVYNRNGSEENSSVRIYIIEHIANSNYIKWIYNDKISDKASDRVIKNRVKKALEIFHQ